MVTGSHFVKKKEVKECIKIANKNGYTEAQARDCDRFSLNCRSCPYMPVKTISWNRNRSVTYDDPPICPWCGARAEIMKFDKDRRLWRCPDCYRYCGRCNKDYFNKPYAQVKAEETPNPVAISITRKTRLPSPHSEEEPIQKKSDTRKLAPTQRVCKYNFAIKCSEGNICDTCDKYVKAILT